MQLPTDLQVAMEAAAACFTGEEGRKAARAVSEKYRGLHRDADHAMVDSEQQAAIYAVTRMPATWAALRASMGWSAESLPDWSPRSMLDVGAGTGAAAWAAADTWPELETVRLFERADAMGKMGRFMAGMSSRPAVREAVWQAGDARFSGLGDAAGLVTAAYMLNEVGGDGEGQVLDALWQATREVLLVVEPGTPEGWRRILRVRDRLLGMGAFLVGPCPHGNPCPVEPPDWCHFTERVNRSRLHRVLKEAEAPYEDEKFSWVAVSRFPPLLPAARVRRHPDIHAGFIRLSLCAQEGLRDATVARSQKMAWKQVRGIRNGDAWNPEG